MVENFYNHESASDFLIQQKKLLLDPVSPFIQNLKPYVAGKSIEEVQRQYGLKEIIKLASNENALGPSPRVLKAIQNSFQNLHMYPDASYFECKKLLADKLKIQPNMISFGNGSNESIDTLIRVFCEPGKDKILIPEASFVAYKVCAHVNRIPVEEVPLKKNYQIDVLKLVESFKNHKIIFLPNPNNPIGAFLTEQELMPLFDLIEQNPGTLFVLDEAYQEFIRAQNAPKSIELLKKYKNLVLMRTTAKVFGIAGLRMGYMIAHPEIISLVEKVRLPFNVNSVAVEAFKACLQDDEYVLESQKLVWNGLDYFYKNLKEMNLEFVESQGNFVFFDTRKDSSFVFEELLKRGVILRPVKNYGFPTHMRMSVGTQRENEIAIQALKEVL